MTPLERNLYGDTSARLLWERQFEEPFVRTWMEKSPELRMYVRLSETRFFLSVYEDDIKMAGKQQNLAPMRKKLVKNVDIDEPT